MDEDFVNTVGKEWEEDKVHFCACGAEKSPNFPMCFRCSKRDQRELDNWVEALQAKDTDWDKVDPFE